MKALVVTLLLIAAFFGLTSVALAQSSDSAGVVAYVNGRPISTKALERELVRIHMSGMMQDSVSRAQFSVDRLVQRLINDAILADEARAIGLNEDPEVADRVTELRDRLAYAKMMAEQFPDTFKASEDEIRREYVHMFERFDLRMICVADSVLSAALADSMRAGAEMAALAQTHSVDRYREKGGAAGYWPLAQAPALLQPSLEKSAPGQLIGPRKLWGVWTLIRVEGRAPADSSVVLDSVRAQLVEKIIVEKRAAALRELANSLRGRVAIKVDSVTVDSILIRMGLGLDPSPSVVARVGQDRALSETDLRNKYIHRVVANTDANPRDVLYGVLDDEIQTLLLREAAAASRYVADSSILVQTRAYEDSILVINYLRDIVEAKVTVSDTAVQNYYERNRDRYREPSRFKISTLTRATVEEAEASYNLLRSGTDFAWLARKQSADDAAERGGDRGWYPNAKIPLEARMALDTLSLGLATTPVRTEDGFVIYRLADRQPGALLPLDRVRGSIESAVKRQAQLDAINATVKELRAAATIQIQEDVLHSLQISGKNEPAPAGHMPMGH